MSRAMPSTAQSGSIGTTSSPVMPASPAHCSMTSDDNGRPLSALALRSRFDKARKAAGIALRLRDIRAETASDTDDLAHSKSCSVTRIATWRSAMCETELASG